MRRKITVSIRIYGGFGIVLAILAVVATITGLKINTISTLQGAYIRTSDNSMQVSAIAGDVTELRRLVRLAAREDDDVAAQRIPIQIKGLAQNLDQVVRDTSSPERQQKLRRMRAVLDNYAGLITRILDAEKQRKDLVNSRMNVAGQSAVQALSDIMRLAAADGDFEAAAQTGITQEALLLTRITALRFLADPKPETVAAVEAAMGRFLDLSGRLEARLRDPQRKALAAQADKLARDYGAVFARTVQSVFLSNELITKDEVKLSDELGRLGDETLSSQNATLQEFEAQTISAMTATSAFSTAAALVGLVLGGGLSLVIARAIVIPLRAMTQAMGRLADGDLTISVPARDRADELGAMAGAVQVFKDNAIRMEQMRAEQEEHKQRAEAERRAALHQIADAFETQVGGVVNAVSAAATQLQASARQMAANATETSAQATTVAGAAEQASANVQTVATASEELAASINEIAQQMERSQDVAQRADQEAKASSDTISQLAETVASIGAIVNLISDIASQTNLLALNATIEAARAGDAGKGFAVVAGEVKTLASQTAKATEEIAAKITSVQSGTEDVVRAISGIARVIEEMSEISATVASAVQQQTAATGEIARNVDQAAQGTQEVSDNIGMVESTARQTGQAATQISDSSSDLSSQSDRLKQEVQRFLQQVRS